MTRRHVQPKPAVQPANFVAKTAHVYRVDGAVTKSKTVMGAKMNGTAAIPLNKITNTLVEMMNFNAEMDGAFW